MTSTTSYTVLRVVIWIATFAIELLLLLTVLSPLLVPGTHYSDFNWWKISVAIIAALLLEGIGALLRGDTA
jgi:hypothetical protein